MKVFISQPMKGKTKEQILAEREPVEAYVRSQYPDKDVTFIQSYLGDWKPETDYAYDEDRISLLYLAKSLALLAEADMVVFMKGFRKYRGCKVEYTTAELYEIPIFELPDPDD